MASYPPDLSHLSTFEENSPITATDYDRFEIVMQDLPEGYPRMTFWRVLIQPVRFEAKTRGGILLTDQARDDQEYLNYMGKVVDIGPKAFQHVNLRADGDEDRIPKVGDWVIFGKASGMRIQYRGVDLRMCEDRDIIAKIDDPRGYRVLF